MMAEPAKIMSLVEQVSKIRDEVAGIAAQLGITPEQALRLLTHREIVILNTQLRGIHEMLDLLYGKKAKKKL